MSAPDSLAAAPPEAVVVEVGPRDGLQNEAVTVPVAARIRLIDRLAAAGLQVIEAGAFVAPSRVPQMADSEKVLAGIARPEGVRFPVLVPNRAGLTRALAAGAQEIAVFAAASETFSERNLNAGIEASLARYRDVVAQALGQRLRVRGYVSCALGCPYEGRIAPAAVARVAQALRAMGCSEIALGDTIGTGTPGTTRDLLQAILADMPAAMLAFHAHDTYGQALANVLIALERGIATIDASVAGLGGCPFAPGAGGNLATEDLLYMLEGSGIRTGVDLDAVIAAGRGICRMLGREPASHLARARAAADR